MSDKGAFITHIKVDKKTFIIWRFITFAFALIFFSYIWWEAYEAKKFLIGFLIIGVTLACGILGEIKEWLKGNFGYEPLVIHENGLDFGSELEFIPWNKIKKMEHHGRGYLSILIEPDDEITNRFKRDEAKEHIRKNKEIWLSYHFPVLGTNISIKKFLKIALAMKNKMSS